MLNLCYALGQQIRKGWVGIFAVIVVLKGLQWRVSRRAVYESGDVFQQLLLLLSFLSVKFLSSADDAYLSVSLSQTGR